MKITSPNETYTVVLAGNPNCGKTTLFNALTGSHQHIGNYPGVTVEKKEGQLRLHNANIRIIDLPGMYDLQAHSPEEEVARNVIETESPDLIISVVDSSSLERNLFLTSQLMEKGIPVLVVLNMTDTAEKKGYRIDQMLLSEAMHVEVVKTIGHKNQGITQLKEKVLQMCQALPYTKKKEATSSYAVMRNISTQTRYATIQKWLQKAVITVNTNNSRFTEKMDEVLTHPLWGVLIFLGLMYLVFTLVFVLGAPFMEWIELFFSWLSSLIIQYWPASFYPIFRSLLVEGIIGGVGGVIVFLPNILLLFLAIAFLEGTGYMSRVAFLMDGFMSKLNLHGKSIVPMLLGFGCSVPAIMATRTLESKQERMTTMMILPLMSCGARLTIYALLIPAFFPSHLHGPMLWLMYVIGVLVAMVAAKLLRKTIFKGDSVPFLIELPEYRMPTIKNLLLEMWNQSKEYLKKAGSIILVLSVLLWGLASFPKIQMYSQDYQNEIQTVQSSALSDVQKEEKLHEIAQEMQEEELSFTYAGRIGRFLEPALRPIGFDWKIGTALIGALAAKEMFVAQLGIVNAVRETEDNQVPLRDKLRDQYTPLVAFCIMLFCLISAPCVATCAVTRRESNSWKWALIQFFGLTVVAYILTFVVYQVGSLL
ncbi:MAG TPA: ferrous iron transport protein B [Caldisericia bacterium]|nr:ferrous iron transport protein B [Caldisericia bacterium]